MGYKSALEAAGAEVLAYKMFGNWQGEWWAKVNLDGVVGWVEGSFGSCSVCDPFQSKMDGFDYRWDSVAREYVDAPEEERQAALVEFGQSYLTHLQTPEEAKAWADQQLLSEDTWRDEDKEAAQFILENM